MGRGRAGNVRCAAQGCATSDRLAELADLGLEQAPGRIAELLLPALVETGAELAPERARISGIEGDPVVRQRRLELPVELVRIGALPPHVLAHVAIDHGLHVCRQRLPE